MKQRHVGIGEEIADGRNSAGPSWSSWARLVNDVGCSIEKNIVVMNVNKNCPCGKWTSVRLCG